MFFSLLFLALAVGTVSRSFSSQIDESNVNSPPAPTGQSGDAAPEQDDWSTISRSRIPPITLAIESSWTVTAKALSQACKKGFTAKKTNNGINLRVESAEDHAAANKQLAGLKIEFSTRPISVTKLMKIVIKGFPLTTSTEEIHEALLELNFNTNRIVQLYRFQGNRNQRTNIPIPVWMVELPSLPVNHNI